ncbi:putative Ubiquitin conjugating enzyme [Trypanosoma vivax]|uniref:Putative ubiquitin-conjugating enzyme e2 n=1 Tax=Trypanosoma vivax (strain Y486) TaxID=1055687 RepID=G0U1K0_TRYVY|nr:putative ubiquitin-conjugating enzyme e2 [Trypanosoma vivax]KAH8617003.1 putative Ubiquitin conjugating enzyme [Trypanosoma vivax]CCC49957.1 putative ubiquitin-conjugating enzyme e2 [Trypanosoma vivax Y486]
MSGTQNQSKLSMRLKKELMELVASGEEGISAFPQNDNLFTWLCTLQGASNTVYEGLEFQLSITFPPGYPYDAPNVRFITPCFHPNVDSRGTICLDILKEKWSAVYTVLKILLSIQMLLGDPNNNSPLNQRAANLWHNTTAFRKEVLAYRESKTDTSQ